MNLVSHERPASIAVNEFGFGLSTINDAAFKGLEDIGFPIAIWDEDVAPYPTEEEIRAAITIGSWKRVRKERNLRLLATDWYALSDITMPEDVATYRQALRDIPQTYNSSKEVIWPSLAADAVSTCLNCTLTEDADVITVDSTKDFPVAGTIQIQDETITYDKKTGVTFGGAVRGAAETTAVAHEIEVVVSIA